MEPFIFYNPTKIFFGAEKVKFVGKEVKQYGKKVLIVIGKGSVKKSGLLDKVASLLKEENLEVYILENIDPNPRISSVREGVNICKENSIDFILAVGGGSVIDASKAIAVGAKYDKDPWDIIIGKKDIKEALPLGVILTLAATGSEMNSSAVISNLEMEQKLGFGHELLRPKFSILDPSLTITVPKNHTIYGAVDILSHVFEQYFDDTTGAELSDRLCEAMMITVIENTEKLIKDLNDLSARGEIMWSSTMALNGILRSGRGNGEWACHGIEHELSAIYDIAHGAGLSIVFPAWMQYVSKTHPQKFVQFGERVLGLSLQDKDEEAAAEMSITMFKKWLQKIGAPISLKEVGINESRLEEMARKATQYGNLGNIVRLDEEAVFTILKLCL